MVQYWILYTIAGFSLITFVVAWSLLIAIDLICWPALKSSKLLEDMSMRGIKYVDCYGVDNALVSFVRFLLVCLVYPKQIKKEKVKELSVLIILLAKERRSRREVKFYIFHHFSSWHTEIFNLGIVVYKEESCSNRILLLLYAICM